ncbi:uncharacterized protein PHACADRAFT_199086 [Phanerochaete carnosa HHB-10118-sp]|uniref:Uncharacterized protein n=1 Tax=Phanerochaete carnosa (strain HHB-10118-sp) TaxID=650164 RepID=K5VJP7_PHACS|nr:uncharacterized protein PHACADRAFT_199086 [Phanerochaete carnosa HHB-10118-sp]EKM51578.1 hypothetical protein PHACADRAFT_199086 [Phanerochaete carnosa HHB-10118-sp]
MINTLVSMPFLRTVMIVEGALIGLRDLQSHETLALSTNKWTSLMFRPTLFGPRIAWQDFLQNIVNLDSLEYMSYDAWRINLTILQSESVVLRLKELSVRLWDNLPTKLVPILERAPGLLVPSGHFNRFPRSLLNLRLQRSQIINKLEPTFPNAERFRFGEAIEWRRDSSGSREWRPCAHFRTLLLELLVEEYDEMQGVAGFLAVFRAANNYCKDMEML